MHHAEPNACRNVVMARLQWQASQTASSSVFSLESISPHGVEAAQL
jgi:hypothetical protein